MKLKFTKKALEEQALYKLKDNQNYWREVRNYVESGERMHARFGYYTSRSTPTRNMLEALRMLPWQNSCDDWARLHVTESLLKMK